MFKTLAAILILIPLIFWLSLFLHFLNHNFPDLLSFQYLHLFVGGPSDYDIGTILLLSALILFVLPIIGLLLIFIDKRMK